MNRSCHWAVPLVAGLIGCGSGGPAGSAPAGAVVLPADVGLQVVKMPELKKAIAAQRGKVVVMDVWADY